MKTKRIIRVLSIAAAVIVCLFALLAAYIFVFNLPRSSRTELSVSPNWKLTWNEVWIDIINQEKIRFTNHVFQIGPIVIIHYE